MGVATGAAVNANGDGIIFFPVQSAATGGVTTTMMAVRVDGGTGTYATAVAVDSATGRTTVNGAAWNALLDIHGNAYVMEDRGVFRIAAGSNSYDPSGLGCTCNNDTGGQMKLDRDGFPMVVWGDGNAVYAGRYH
jgi:hypothetical protein